MIKTSKKVFALLLVSISAGCLYGSPSGLSAAEKLVTVAPDDMIIFIAASGANDLGPAFDESVLGQVCNDAGIKTFYQAIKQEVLKQIANSLPDPNEKKEIESAMSLAKFAADRPVLVGAARKTNTTDEIPVYGFVLIDAGPGKEELKSILFGIEARYSGGIIDVNVGSYVMHGTGDDMQYWGWVGNYFIVAGNDREGAALKNLKSPKSKAQVNYFSKVPKSNDAIVMYSDMPAMIDIIKQAMKVDGDEKEIPLLESAMKQLGLSGIKKTSARAGFAGSEMVVDELLEISGPPSGLMSCLKPIKLSALDMVDRRAMNTEVFNFDMAKVYDIVLNTIKIVSPNEVYPYIEAEIAKFESEAKFSIRNELLQNLSGETICYAIPAGVSMDMPNGGSVVIAKLNDPNIFEKAFVAVGELIASKSDGMMQISSVPQDDKTLHIWNVMPMAMMQIIPTWTIVDGYFIFGSNAALCDQAVAQMSSPEKSIRSVEGYKKVTANLPKDLISFGYIDSKVQFKQTVMAIQQFWPMMTMGAAKEGLNLPFMLPDVSGIADKMEPSCGYSWFDSQGLRSHYKGTGIEQSVGSIVGVAFVAGITMPALSRVRHISKRMESSGNLSEIGKALLIYSNDCNGQFPDDLEVLVEKAYIEKDILRSPRKPKCFQGPSYIYITGQSPNSPPTNIFVYENPDYCDDKVNVLFADGHVECMVRERFSKELEKTYKQLGREMPDLGPKPCEANGSLEPLSKLWSDESKLWALGCAGVLNECGNGLHGTLSPRERTESNIERQKKSLDEWWGVKNRDDLLDTLKWLEDGGHCKDFDNWGKYLKTLTGEEYQTLVKEKENDKEELCEIVTAKQYHEKLGEKSILGWDYSRYICLCRWGYLIGYLSEDEAWQLIMPIAETLQDKFDSWEDLGRNYLIGRKFWSHKHTVEGGDLYEDAFNRLCDMKSSPWNKYPWDMKLTFEPVSPRKCE